jgi:NADPH:quinone reductase-like Zn-dependent oxidoreductase
MKQTTTAVKASQGSSGALEFKLVEEALPQLQPGQLLLRVRAAAIGDADWNTRKALLSQAKLANPPLVPCFEVAGTVEAVGPRATLHSLQTGDEVACLLPPNYNSALSELIVVHQEHIVPKPKEVSFEDAAAFLLPAVRAYTALHYHARVRPEDTVLVLHGASAAGHIAVQLAASLGAYVIATASTPEEYSYLHDLPTPIARIVDLSTQDLLSAIDVETGHLGVHVLLDNPSPGAPEIDSAVMLGCVGMNGALLTHRLLEVDDWAASQLLLRSARVGYVMEHSWTLAGTQLGKLQHILADAMERLLKGVLKVRIARVFNVDQIKDAVKLAETVPVGRVVIKFS